MKSLGETRCFATDYFSLFWNLEINVLHHLEYIKIRKEIRNCQKKLAYFICQNKCCN